MSRNFGLKISDKTNFVEADFIAFILVEQWSANLVDQLLLLDFFLIMLWSYALFINFFPNCTLFVFRLS